MFDEKTTLDEWKDWAYKIISGKWHTVMLNAFCNQAIKDRERLDELEKLIIETSDYLDTNDLTSIGHNSILHRKFKAAIREK